MEQKQQFMSLLMSDQFTMSELCLTFGISRKTGHKWRDRYVEEGMSGLEARSRAPKSVTSRTDEAVERMIVLERRLHPTWGAKKIQRVLSVKHGLEQPPVVSTVGEVLKRHGMVKVRRRRGGLFTVERGTLTAPERSNVSAQQNPSIQGMHRCHRFEIYGNYTRDNINRISEE